VILYGFYKIQLKYTKGVRIILHKDPWNFLNLTDLPLPISTQNPTRLTPTHRDPGGAGELASGEGAPELGNKRHLAAIRRTRARLGVVAGPMLSPASGGGGALEARPWRSDSGEGRSGAKECVARLGPT
jgi:hypothetical protein